MLPKNTKSFTILVFVFTVVIFFAASKAKAQDIDISSLKERAAALVKENKYIDALPLFEKIAIVEPDNAENQFQLGAALLAKTRVVTDKEEIKNLFMRSRDALLKAKKLGYPEPKLDAVIKSIPEDGTIPSYTQNADVEKIMQEGEAFFAQGKMDNALEKYQKALKLDPTLYYAALYSGDAYLQKGDFDKAEIWYQKAIQIDPNRETAYRYSATPLMKQKKYDQARDRYVEAYITEPFNNYTAAGLGQWAQVTGAKLGHPRIEIPTSFAADENGNSKINLNESTLGGKDDGSNAWLAYGITRASWQKEFVKNFPNEKTYRHSLAEEVDALQSVITLAAADKKVKNLSPSLAKLKELNDKGLLESYILLARADKGIYQDYAEYLKSNRDKLRRYVVEYILTGGGK
ncbi:MAG: tetratricopeptide repeat protein [Pyrinomonadaceae bacterium]